MFSLYNIIILNHITIIMLVCFFISLDSRIRARVVSTAAEIEDHYNLSLSDYLDELAPSQNQITARRKVVLTNALR